MLKTMLSVDLKGLITSFGDGGDSCCRNYTFHLRNAILAKLGLPQSSSTPMVADPYKTMMSLEVDDGVYVRSPTLNVLTSQPMWYNNPATTSRDQLTPVICYNAFMAFHGAPAGFSALGRLISKCQGRFGFAQNNQTADGKSKIPDFMTPDLWSISARAHGYIFYPVIAVLDVFILLSIMFKLWAPIVKDSTLNLRLPGPTDTDDENINNIIMAAQHTFDTPFSWLARKLYKRFRGQNVGNTYFGEKNPIMGALVAYSNDNGCAELAEMARPIVEKY